MTLHVVKVSEGKSTRHMTCELHWKDIMPLLRRPWEQAFSLENIAKAWSMVGQFPFTRCVEVMLRDKEKQNEVIDQNRNKLEAQIHANLNHYICRSSSWSASSSSSSSAAASSSASSYASASSSSSLPKEKSENAYETIENDDNSLDNVEESDEDEASVESHAAESRPGERKKRNKKRSSAIWWARGSLTASEVYKEREKFEKAEAKKHELKNAKLKKRDAKNAAIVFARQASGWKILKTDKSFSELNVEQLKDVSGYA